MKNNKVWKHTLIIVQTIVGILFLLAGAAKFLAAEMWIKKFSQWHYPDKFYMIVGFVEFVAAILLFVPKISKYAVISLIFVMIAAILTHVVHQESTEIFRPGIYLVLLVTIIFLKRKANNVQ
ncbi:MAG: DoxX family protein [Calditrichaeota bacterium]|nr:DoxX family protein [Calditrichota bacterium]